MLPALLTVLTFFIQGYHPLAEDGGLYAAGIEYTLDHSLFPHQRRFVTEHLHFSVFAPVMAAIVRLTHLSLEMVLLLAYLGSIALTLIAARSVLRRAVKSERAQLAGIAMLAAMWTVPVAGTSLILMDPYVTARSFSTPLSLFAIAFAMDPWPSGLSRDHVAAWRSLATCIVSLGIAAALHPLMAGYALGFILVLRLLSKSRAVSLLVLLAVLTLAGSAVLQAVAPAEDPAVVAAAFTRYYWFLSQWHWYELAGLAGPLLVLMAILRGRGPLREPGKQLCRAAIFLGALSVVVALLFAHESYRTHLVARLQPLRCFLLVYAVMILLLGAALQRLAESMARHASRPLLRRVILSLPMLAIAGTAVGLFAVQRADFPASAHLELPWRARESPNPWVRAFLWCRNHTPADALFAMDAHYITMPGEDAQTFRAIAERSALPDFSKDGGEAAITPALADAWAEGVRAQLGLSYESDDVRLARLRPLGANWLVLLSSASTQFHCPYDNGTVKVCQIAH